MGAMRVRLQEIFDEVCRSPVMVGELVESRESSARGLQTRARLFLEERRADCDRLLANPGRLDCVDGPTRSRDEAGSKSCASCSGIGRAKKPRDRSLRFSSRSKAVSDEVGARTIEPPRSRKSSNLLNASFFLPGFRQRTSSHSRSVTPSVSRARFEHPPSYPRPRAGGRTSRA